MANTLLVEYLGDAISYTQGMELMREVAAVIKVNGDAHEKLLLLEHRPTVTTTRSSASTSLRVSHDAIVGRGIEVVESDRGGDVTFHGPGQLVGYPVFRLKKLADPLSRHAYDLLGYVRTLEQALVDSCRELGVSQAQCLAGFTGVWVPRDGGSFSKLVAIGVGVKGGVSQHGFALNVDNDYRRFLEVIVPCGLAEMGVCNLAELLIERHLPTPSMIGIREVIAENIRKNFGYTSLTIKSCI